MTLRAVMVGLLLAVLIGGFGYVNDQVLNLESVTAGTLLPISVFALLVVAVLVINPALSLLGRRWRFRPAELAWIVLAMLVACSICGRGLMETFTQTLALPAWHNARSPGWQQRGLLGWAPPELLVLPEPGAEAATDDFYRGKAPPNGRIGLEDIPWRHWAGPLGRWLPLVLLTAVSSICMALIVHRQWVRREHLRYPIAEVARSLIAPGPNGGLGPVFRAKGFWVALAAVLFVRVLGGLHAWFPNTPVISLRIDLLGARHLFPFLANVQWGYGLLWPMLYPTVVAFSFMLASEITLSMGLSQFLCAIVAGTLVSFGVDISVDYMTGGSFGWQRFGSYLALFLILVYVGRGYYLRLLKEALTFRRQEGVEPYAAWACRILLVCLAAATVMLVGMGLSWPLALLTVGLIMLTFVCLSRISAETGLFMIHPRWQALGVFLGLFGAHAMGPTAIIIVGMVCAILAVDPSQAVMPYFLNGLKAADDLGVRPARAGIGSVGVYAVVLAVAVPVVLWANYNYGLRPNEWSIDRVPTMAFRAADAAANELEFRGRLAESFGMDLPARLLAVRPRRAFLWWAGAGFLAVLLFGALRLRFHWWPLHPLIFLVWATWPMQEFGHSFLLGWALKKLLTKYGGYAAVRRATPAVIGVILGDILGAAIFMGAGGLYYAATGMEPQRFSIFPR
ncbi:MAG TPA: DUF6785 family protein [Phycisphaerae bacterium]|nr:DUF6785 family protein [Phycisphaerae bacterium]